MIFFILTKLSSEFSESIFYDSRQMNAVGPWQYSFSDPATPIMEGIINFHNDLIFSLVAIIIFGSTVNVMTFMFLINWTRLTSFFDYLVKKFNRFTGYMYLLVIIFISTILYADLNNLTKFVYNFSLDTLKVFLDYFKVSVESHMESSVGLPAQQPLELPIQSPVESPVEEGLSTRTKLLAVLGVVILVGCSVLAYKYVYLPSTQPELMKLYDGDLEPLGKRKVNQKLIDLLDGSDSSDESSLDAPDVPDTPSAPESGAPMTKEQYEKKLAALLDNDKSS